MIGWLIIAIAIIAIAAVLHWWLKGRGIGGYSDADQSAIEGAQEDIRSTQRRDARVRRRERWSAWLRN